jgi:hypothetical protein
LIDNLPKIDAGMAGLKKIDYVLRKLAWMRSQRIWPNGPALSLDQCFRPRSSCLAL